ncbi:hypothetical protein AZL_011350 [Azospirillum sp. B510]|uniref:YsnF/AvaK domain-containing protein n=1 Tax=Azospirillum sp. (strain B510) TaxID=137722 RepID=UPI0001C4BF45|nr:YsnF/AvaK domain-containing protein [Azospirillum sp. B510]BAI71773.1 hypothetical protein AZL_011350 [Azospirillum sp. B510]
MSKMIVGLYKEPNAAKTAFQALVAAGCRDEDLETFNEAAGSERAIEELLEHGFDKDMAQRYASAVQQGHTLLMADIADKDADAAQAILEDNGAMDLADAGRQAEKRAGKDNNGKAQHKATEETVIPVIEEEVEIGKRQTTGSVRVSSEVTETPVRKTVHLRDETVGVEQRKADRAPSKAEADAAFTGKTVEMTATSETAKVAKEARVVGEVVLEKSASEREETVETTARRTDVKVERAGGKPQAKR